MDDFDLYRLFKTLHILAVMALAGGVAIDTLVGPLMAKAKNITELKAYVRMGRISEDYVQIPAAVLIILFGYATADRLGIDLDTTWLLIAQVLFYAVLAVFVLYMRRALKELDTAIRPLPEGPIPDNVRAMITNPMPGIVGSIMGVAFIVIVYLMVAKPAW